MGITLPKPHIVIAHSCVKGSRSRLSRRAWTSRSARRMPLDGARCLLFVAKTDSRPRPGGIILCGRRLFLCRAAFVSRMLRRDSYPPRIGLGLGTTAQASKPGKRRPARRTDRPRQRTGRPSERERRKRPPPWCPRGPALPPASASRESARCRRRTRPKRPGPARSPETEDTGPIQAIGF